MALHTNSKVILFSNDRALEEGFDRVKQQALSWAFDDGEAGLTYEAALPGREAFCMRDVSHQCIGAEVLGLHAHNKNMMRWFARVPGESTDWCSWWEIDRYGRPCPVDYAGDDDFWYNLPANFDVTDALYRLYRWSGDGDYLDDPDFRRFIAVTLENYVRRWDRDGDGIPDRVLSEGRRGLASYDESEFACNRLKVGGDLIAIQARGTLSAAAMYGLRGQDELRRVYEGKARRLLDRLFSMRDPERGFPEGVGFDGAPVYTGHQHLKTLLYYRVLPPEQALECARQVWKEFPEMIVERASHVPEILFACGMNREGLEALWRMMSPTLRRREYPEVSFSAVGATAAGLMGIDPDAASSTVATLSGLSGDLECRLLHVPVCGAEIAVAHRGESASALTHESGAPLIWRACFRGEGTVEGHCTRVRTDPLTGGRVSFAEIPVGPGEEVECRFVKKD